MPETYRLRGIRVRPLSHQQIANTAISVCKTFKLSRKKSKSFYHFFESLYLLGIELKVEESDEWLYLTKGLCDPKRKEILVPEHIYQNACIGEQEALSVMFHEIGHLFLNHSPYLHFSDVNPKIEEDAEWQADTFSDVALEYLGYNPDQLRQLSFDFSK